jgi:outer membrane protein assembly factor BamD
MKTRTVLIAILLFLLPAFMSGCSYFRKPNPLDVSPEELIERGMKAMQKKRYQEAVETFQQLRDRHPYSELAILAELKRADALYLHKDYQEAHEAYEEFERMHPNNEAIPYVIFQQGMCFYQQRRTRDRDQTASLKAMQTFNRLIQAYPSSPDAEKAAPLVKEARGLLAGHEFIIGEFYFNKKKWRAAQARFEGMLKVYPGTAYDEQARDYIKRCHEKIAAEAPAKEPETGTQAKDTKLPAPRSRIIDKSKK